MTIDYLTFRTVIRNRKKIELTRTNDTQSTVKPILSGPPLSGHCIKRTVVKVLNMNPASITHRPPTRKGTPLLSGRGHLSQYKKTLVSSVKRTKFSTFIEI